MRALCDVIIISLLPGYYHLCVRKDFYFHLVFLLAPVFQGFFKWILVSATTEEYSEHVNSLASFADRIWSSWYRCQVFHPSSYLLMKETILNLELFSRCKRKDKRHDTFAEAFVCACSCFVLEILFACLWLRPYWKLGVRGKSRK